MGSFAHLSDIHLGFQKHEGLQRIEQEAFERVIDECISLGVDFVLIPGDIFHTNVPEMRVQKFAFAKFRQLHEAGIPAYVVYGSHDFSPVENSVIDLLAETGYITKVTRQAGGQQEGGGVRLGFVTDGRTGAKIAGLSGLKAGKDREYYENLDRGPLESETGFKIFLFHAGISEMIAGGSRGSDWEVMPLSLLPRGFSYYAGGHLHAYHHQEFDGHPHVVYPGTPFAGYHSDLEENARGQKRGFVLVRFGGEAVESVEFVRVEIARYGIIEVDANNRGSESVDGDLQDKVDRADPEGKIMVVKVRGKLSSGKTSDVDVSGARERLVEAGAPAVNISRNQLTSKEYDITESKGESRDEVESNLFKENIGQLNFSQRMLTGDDGVRLAKELLMCLGQSQVANEKKADYTARVTDAALAAMGVGREDDP